MKNIENDIEPEKVDDLEKVWNEQDRIESNKFWREWCIGAAMANGKGVV